MEASEAATDGVLALAGKEAAGSTKAALTEKIAARVAVTADLVFIIGLLSRSTATESYEKSKGAFS